MKITAVLLLGAPLVSAWSLKLYDDELYKNKIHDRSGTFGQPCRKLTGKETGAESMQWVGNTLTSLNRCKIQLYTNTGCSQLDVGDSGYGNWNVPKFSSAAANKVKSYDITCR